MGTLSAAALSEAHGRLATTARWRASIRLQANPAKRVRGRGGRCQKTVPTSQGAARGTLDLQRCARLAPWGCADGDSRDRAGIGGARGTGQRRAMAGVG